LRALSHRNFRLFWTGHLVSLVGTWMQTVAQGWLVLELTNDPFALGLTIAFQFAPVLVLGLFGGVIADAWPKRRSLIFTQLSALLLALVLGVLAATGTVEVWHVYALALGLGVINAIDMPVRQSFVVEMVGREDIANAVALNSAIFNGARIVGPAVAGLVIGVAGVAPAFFLNAVSYLAVLAGMFAIRVEELALPAVSTFDRSWRGVLDQLREGLVYLRATPQILLPIGVLGGVAMAGMNQNVLLPVYARDVLAGGADTFGFLMAASGLGSLASALFIAFGARPSMRLLLLGAAVVGAAVFALSFTTSFVVALVLMVLIGWGVIAMAATTNTMIQLAVPDELRGRVVSVYTTVFAGSAPVGGFLAGWLANVAGVAVALMVGGALSLGVAAAGASRLAAHGQGPARAPVGPTHRAAR